MSWLSDRLGTTGKTPAFIKNVGNALGGTVLNAVPFGIGDSIDKLFGVTPRGSSGPSLAEIAAATADTLEGRLKTANQLGAAQSQTSEIFRVLSTPIGLIAVAGLAWLLLRKK